MRHLGGITKTGRTIGIGCAGFARWGFLNRNATMLPRHIIVTVPGNGGAAMGERPKHLSEQADADSAEHAAEPPAEVGNEIPRAAVGRLSLYLRELRRLSASGADHASSKRLGELLGVSDAVVRRDLAYLKPQGRRGVGYLIEPLIQRIRQTLGSNHVWNVVLLGAGSLGNALLRYQGFQEQGFRWVAAFDVAAERVGSYVEGVPVFHSRELEQRIAKLQANLAIIAVPAAATTDVARRLSAAGITGILNFAPVALQVGPETCVANVDLASELQQLAFSVLTTREPVEPPPEETGTKPQKNR